MAVWNLLSLEAQLARWPSTVGLRELCGVAENRGSQGTLITQCSCLGRTKASWGRVS